MTRARLIALAALAAAVGLALYGWLGVSACPPPVTKVQGAIQVSTQVQCAWYLADFAAWAAFSAVIGFIMLGISRRARPE